MTQDDTQFLIVGKLSTPYGIKGWLKLMSYTETPTTILAYQPWYVEDHGDWKKMELEDGREHGKGLIAKLAGLNTPEQAKLLAGKKIAILRSQLPKLPENEYYWSDLQGLIVINQHGDTLGKIIHIIDTGSNDVLVIKGDKEHAIPYLVGRVIKKIDLQAGTMHVDWDEL